LSLRFGVNGCLKHWRQARYRGQRPLLLQNASRNLLPEAHRLLWSRASLLDRYGSEMVQLSSPINLVDNRIAAGHAMSFSKCDVLPAPASTLTHLQLGWKPLRFVEQSQYSARVPAARRYVEMMRNTGEIEARGLTLVDPRGVGSLWQLSAFLPPALLGFADAPPTDWSFALGWAGSGVPFHVRAESWSELIWGGGVTHYLYPPEVTPARGYNVHHSAVDWVRRNYKKNGRWKKSGQRGNSGGAGVSPPLQCMQRPGDVLYIPGGWYRSSVHCGETVTVTGRERRVDSGGYVEHMALGMELVKDGKHEEAARELRQADRLSNHSNDAVLYNLGRVLVSAPDHRLWIRFVDLGGRPIDVDYVAALNRARHARRATCRAHGGSAPRRRSRRSSDAWR
jgi:hypothetical protein